MILVPHILLHLLLRSLELVHDLAIALFDRLRLISLAVPQKLKRLFPVIDWLILPWQLLFIEASHLSLPFILFVRGVSDCVFSGKLFLSSEHLYFLTERLISLAQALSSHGEALSIASFTSFDFDVYLLQGLNDVLLLFRLHAFLVLLNFVLFFSLFLQEWVDAFHTLLLQLLKLLFVLNILFLTIFVSFFQLYSLLAFFAFENLVHGLALRILSLFELLNI